MSTLLKQDFGSTQVYRAANKIVLDGLTNFLDAYIPAPSVKDINPSFKGALINRQQAIERLWFKVKNPQSTNEEYKKLTDSKEDLILKEAYLRLSDPSVFMNMIKDYYPNVKMKWNGVLEMVEVLKEEDDTQDSKDDETLAAEQSQSENPDSTEDSSNTVHNEWFDKENNINPIQRASSAVKDFMLTTVVRDKEGNIVRHVSPDKAFIYLLEGLDDVSPYIDDRDRSIEEALDKETYSLKDGFTDNLKRGVRIGDYSTDASAVYNKILNLIKIAHDKPTSTQFELRYAGDNLKGAYELVDKVNKVITPIEVVHTDGTILKIKKYMKSIPEDQRLSLEDIHKLYNSLEAADIINSIYNVANSLRKRNPWFIKYNKEFISVEDVLPKTVIAKVYDYVEYTAEVARLKREENLLNSLNINADKLIDLKLTNKSKGEIVAKAYKLAKIRINSTSEVNNDLIIIIDKLIEKKNNLERYENDSSYANKLDNDLQYYVANLVRAEYQTLDISNTTYIGGDNNARWFFSLGSNITQTLKRIIKYKDIRLIPIVFRNSVYSINYFLPGQKHTLLKNKGIYSIVDHDSIQAREITVFDKPITYLKEQTRDWYIRNVITGFGRFIMKTNKRKNITGSHDLRYIQQLYTPSDSKSLVSVETNAIYEHEYKAAIMTQLVQYIELLKKTQSPTSLGPRKQYYNSVPSKAPFDLQLSKKEISKLLKTDFNKKDREGIIKMFNEDKLLSSLVEKAQDFLNNQFEEAYNHFVQEKVPVPFEITKILTLLKEHKAVDNEESLELAIKEATAIVDNTENKWKNDGYYQGRELEESAKPYVERAMMLDPNRVAPLTESAQADYDTMMKPLFKTFFYSSVFNSQMINQLTSGFNAEYKDAYDQTKRESMVNGMGAKGRINDETGLKQTYRLAVAHDLVNFVIEDETDPNFTPFLSLFEPLRTRKGYEYSDAQSFIIPYRAKNIRKGFSRYSNNGETLKNLHSGFDIMGDMVGVKTSSRELSNAMMKDLKRRALRKFMEFGHLPSVKATILNEEIENINEYANDLFDKIHNNINSKPSDEDLIMYDALLDYANDNNYMIHEIAFGSAIKMGKPTTAYRFNFESKKDKYGNSYLDMEAIKEYFPGEELSTSSESEKDPILTLFNDDYRLQLNPRKAESKNREVHTPSQLIYLLFNNPENYDYAKQIFNLISNVHTIGTLNTKLELFKNKDGIISEREIKNFLKRAYKTLSSSPNMEYFSSKMQELEHIPMGIVNASFASNKLAQTLISIYQRNTIRYKAPGGGYVLESAAYSSNPPEIVYEITTNEGEKKSTKNMTDTQKKEYHILVRDGKAKITSYYAEVKVPRSYVKRLYKDIADLKDDAAILAKLEERGLDLMMGYRLPSTELHSSIPLKIAGFNESNSLDNIITVPPEIVLLHGSGYAGDKLYILDPYVPSETIKIPYKTITGDVKWITLHKGLPVEYERITITDKEGKKYSISRKRDDTDYKDTEYSSFRDFLVNYVYNNTLSYIEEELKRPYKDRLSDSTISDILKVFQNLSYDEMQRHFIKSIQDTRNQSNMMMPITLSPVNDIENPNSIFSQILPLIAKRMGIAYAPLEEHINNGGTKEEWLKSVKKIIKPKRFLDNPAHQAMMHKDNRMAADMVGIFAQGAKGISNLYAAAQKWGVFDTLSEETPQLNSKYQFYWGDKHITQFNRDIYNYPYNYSVQMDMLINASLDHVKEQILNILNMGDKVANEVIAMTALGLSLYDITILINQPIITAYLDNGGNNIAYSRIKELYVNTILNKREIEKEEDRIKEREKILKDISTKEKDSVPFNLNNMANTFRLDFKDLTEDHLFSQLKIFNEYSKIQSIAKAISDAAKVGGNSSQISKDLMSVQNDYNQFNLFSDQNNNKKGVFTNIDFREVPHVSSAFKAEGAMLQDASKLFLKNNNVLYDFIVNTIEPILINLGLTPEDISEAFSDNSSQDSLEDTEDIKTSISNFEEEQNTTNNSKQKGKDKAFSPEEIELYIQQLRLADGRLFIDEEQLRKNLSTLSISPRNKTSLGTRRIEAINIIAQKFVDYLLPMATLSSSFVNMPLNTKNQSPNLSVMFKNVKVEGEWERQSQIIEVNSVNAWIYDFLRDGYTITVYDNTQITPKPIELKVLPLNIIIDKYQEQFKALSELTPNAPRYNRLRFITGASMDFVKSIEFEDQIKDLINVPIYQIVSDNIDNSNNNNKEEEKIYTLKEISDMFNLELPKFNHLQASLAKYAVLKEGLNFSSHKISKNIPSYLLEPILKSISQVANNLYYKGRSTQLSETPIMPELPEQVDNQEEQIPQLTTIPIIQRATEEGLYNFQTFGQNFMAKFLLTQHENLKRGVWNLLVKKNDKPVHGIELLTSGEKIYYDAKIKKKNNKSKTRPFITVGGTVMIAIYETYNNQEENVVYYRAVGKGQDQYSFYNSIDNLSTNYQITDKIKYDIPDISISSLVKIDDNTFNTTIPKDSFEYYNTTLKKDNILSIKEGDTVSLYPKGDSIKESAQLFIIQSIEEGEDIKIDRVLTTTSKTKGVKTYSNTIPAVKITFVKKDNNDYTLEKAVSKVIGDNTIPINTNKTLTEQERLEQRAKNTESYVYLENKKNVIISENKNLSLSEIKNNPTVYYLAPNTPHVYKEPKEMKSILSLPNVIPLYIFKNNGVLFNSKEKEYFIEELDNTFNKVKEAIKTNKVIIPNNSIIGFIRGEDGFIKMALHRSLGKLIIDKLKEIGIQEKLHALDKIELFYDNGSLIIENLSTKQRESLDNDPNTKALLLEPTTENLTLKDKENMLACL